MVHPYLHQRRGDQNHIRTGAQSFLAVLCICAGFRHQADLPSASHSLECEGAPAGRSQRAQRPPRCLHGDKRGRQENHPLPYLPRTEGGGGQGAADALSGSTQDAHEDRKSAAWTETAVSHRFNRLRERSLAVFRLLR